MQVGSSGAEQSGGGGIALYHFAERFEHRIE